MRTKTLCFIIFILSTVVLPNSLPDVIYAEYKLEQLVDNENDLIELILKDKAGKDYDTIIELSKAELRSNPEQSAFKSIIDSLAADTRPLCYLISFYQIIDKENTHLITFENVSYTDYIDSIRVGNYSVYRHREDGKIKKDFIIKFNRDSFSGAFPGKLFCNTELSNKVKIKKVTVPDTTFLMTNLTALNTYSYAFMEQFGNYDTILIDRPGCRIVNCPNEEKINISLIL